MPKFPGWDKQGKDSWIFEDLIFVEGFRTAVAVHVWEWGSGTGDWYAEVYFEHPDVEDYSQTITANGEASEHADTADSMTEAIDRARDYMRSHDSAHDIRSSVGVSEGVDWDKVNDLYWENPEAEQILKASKEDGGGYRVSLYNITSSGRDLMGSAGAGATEADAADRLVEIIESNPRRVSVDDIL